MKQEKIIQLSSTTKNIDESSAYFSSGVSRNGRQGEWVIKNIHGKIIRIDTYKDGKLITSKDID